jgi:signal transduction histidine kinase
MMTLAGPDPRDRLISVSLVAACALNLATLPVFFFVALPRGYYAEAPAAYVFFSGISIAHVLLANAARRRPLLAAVLASWLFFFLLLTYQFGRWLPIKLLLLLGFVLQAGALARRPWNAIASLGAVLCASVVHAAVLRDSGALSAETAFDLAVVALTLAVCAALACLAAGYRERTLRLERETKSLKAMAENLTQAQLEYLEFAKSASERSQAEERNRLSAELHDSMGYAFTNLEMILEAGKDLMDTDPARLRELLETGLEQVRQGMRETRKTLYLLRDKVDQPLFFGAVQKLVDVFRKATGIHAQVDYANFPQDCDAAIKTAFYHFIQEGLVNSFNHGKASRVYISFRVDEEGMRVTMRDDGVGAGSMVEGIGIRGMRERLGKIGGTLGMENLEDGFQIVASVPTNG